MFLDIPFYRSGDYTNYDPGASPRASFLRVVSVIAIFRQQSAEPSLVLSHCVSDLPASLNAEMGM